MATASMALLGAPFIDNVSFVVPVAALGYFADICGRTCLPGEWQDFNGLAESTPDPTQWAYDLGTN